MEKKKNKGKCIDDGMLEQVAGGKKSNLVPDEKSGKLLKGNHRLDRIRNQNEKDGIID